jgi:putative ABC transport system permease protein
VTVVSEAMAAALWPGREAIGQCIHVAIGQDPDPLTAPCATVVGIARNIVAQDLTGDTQFMYYLSVDQYAPGALLPMVLRLSTPEVNPHLERVRIALTAAMPGDGLVFVRPLQVIVDDKSRSWRLGATLFVILGGLALVVAAVGLYGVISYDVTGRAHELGVRAALGARRGDLVRLVVSQGVRLAVVGVVIGAAVALAASRWVQPLLFQLSPTDPITFASVITTMLLIALVASLWPALRATRADPMEALRAD